jgi:thymidylate kinase
MIIAFIGNDGSGKTTVARKVETRLRDSGFEVKYFPSFNHGLLEYVLRMLPGKELKKTRANFLDKGSSNRVSPIFKIWPYIVFVDCLFMYVKFKILNRHSVIILDRYFYDFLIGFEYLGFSSSVVHELFVFGSPRPNIGFVMDVDPQVAYERKKETHDTGLVYYVMQRKRYVKLAHCLGLQIINTEGSVMKSTEQAMAQINNHLIFKECEV